jgi:hypothetical protein
MMLHLCICFKANYATYYFSDSATSQNTNRKISATSAVIKVILVWVLYGTSFQHHMAKVHETDLGNN